MKQPKVVESDQNSTAHRNVADLMLVKAFYHRMIWRKPETAYQAARHVAETLGYTPAELAELIANTPQRFGRLNGTNIPFYGPTKTRDNSLYAAAHYPAVAHHLHLAQQELAAQERLRFHSVA